MRQNILVSTYKNVRLARRLMTVPRTERKVLRAVVAGKHKT